MAVNWEQEFDSLSYVEYETYCIEVLMVVTLNVMLIIIWFMVCRQ